MTFTPEHPRLDPVAENFSESVLLTAITPDARSGVFARLCRYPDAGVAWVWVHLVAGDRSWTFVDDDAPCGPDHLDLDGDSIRYDARPAADAVWSRMGTRQAPTGAALELSIREARVDVSFTPGHATGGSLPGRTEVLGRSTVRATVAGFAIEAETDGGDTIRGDAEIGHSYSLPVYGRRWAGTFVTAEVAGQRLAGFVNRWDPNAKGHPS